MTRKHCSIVIRAFNEERFIAKALTGIKQQIDVETEVILVDSGSTDSTVSIAEDYGAKVVHIRPEDFTFGRALNIGCEAASNDLLVFASAHVYPVYRDWLKHVLEPFSRPAVGLSYGRQIGNEITKYSEHRLFAKWFPEVSDENQSHPFCNNANTAVRRSVWETYRYDESLTGLEDLDFAKRILRDGHQVAYRADAPVVHVHEETPARIYNRYRREAIALKQIIPSERMTVFDLVRLFVGNTVSDVAHAAYERRLRGNLLSIPVFRLMQFAGAYRGFRQRGPIGSALRQRFYYPNEIRRIPTEPPRVEQVRVNYESHDVGSRWANATSSVRT
ncbi:MAG: glycosyltransferase family 2 protein [Planctomycetota bacterium]